MHKIKHNIIESWSCDDFKLTFEPVEDSIIVEKTEEGYKVKYLTIDQNAQNPRVDFEPLGIMICLHSRYNLGDKHSYKKGDFNGQNELEELIERDYGEIAVILPLYLYDHSGLRMSTGSFHDYWDSGQVGVIFVTKKKVIEEYGDCSEESIEKATKYLKAEVETYDEYLSGEVYCTVIETYDEDKEQITYDVVGGYYGYEYAKETLKEDM